MKILLVNVDSRWNTAIRKMFNYYKQKHEAEMIDLGFSGYPHKRTKIIDGAGYDKVFVSNIFDINKDRVTVKNCVDVQFGGIGSNNPHLQLPWEIEMTDPFYYPDEDTSYGFITRGCIRNCWFCKVPKYEGKLKEYNTVESIVKHKKVKFLDNKDFLIDYTAYCNQAGMFKNLTFDQFLVKRVEGKSINEERRQKSLQIYNMKGVE